MDYSWIHKGDWYRKWFKYYTQFNMEFLASMQLKEKQKQLWQVYTKIIFAPWSTRLP